MPTLFDQHAPDDATSVPGEQLRDAALGYLKQWRAALVRRMQRAFVAHLLAHGPATSDAVRAVVAVPAGIDPRCVGAAVRGLFDDGVIRSAGRTRSRRPEAHARMVEVWTLTGPADAAAWLAAHPDLGPPAATN